MKIDMDLHKPLLKSLPSSRKSQAYSPIPFACVGHISLQKVAPTRKSPGSGLLPSWAAQQAPRPTANAAPVDSQRPIPSGPSWGR